MIKGDYDWLQDLAKYNVCADCGNRLEVCWLGSENSYVLGCGNCGYIDTLTRQLSLTQEYKAGANIPEPIRSNIQKGMRRRQMVNEKQVIMRDLGALPNKDLATGELLAPELVKALVNYAYKYKLDPVRGHVVLMYGKPYITIDGYLYYARISGKPYTLSARPLTTQEEKQYKIGKTDHAWLAMVTFLETDAVFTGLGIVTYEEMIAKSPRDETRLRSPVVAAHPWQLAQKRAEWQALRRAFPIGETPPLSDSPPLKEEE